jgi:hypothetical protein
LRTEDKDFTSPGAYSRAGHRLQRRTIVAKGQKRSNREIKKPKADKGKKTIAAASPFAAANAKKKPGRA